MFKVPKFDKDVPKTDMKAKRKVPNNKQDSKQNHEVKKHNIEKTANSIIKAKDKLKNAKQYEVQENIQVKSSTNIQETLAKKSKTSEQEVNNINSVNGVPQEPLEIKKSVANNKNKKDKSKNIHESGVDWLESDFIFKKTGNKHFVCQLKFESYDEELLKADRKTVNESIEQDEQEAQRLFMSNKPLMKKDKLRRMLTGQKSLRALKVKTSLRERMLEQLRSAQFRYLNEKLYTSSGQQAQALFGADPAAFRAYHAGYQQQLSKWPLNPLHLIAKRIKVFPKTHVVADMGCGEGALATLVPQTVHGFDLVSASGAAGAARVTACDMARTPLPPAAVHVAVYCLALMGTNLTEYLLEANRILKEGGHLLIAEVESRFESAEEFARGVTRLGFKLARLDKSHQFFYFLEFVKTRASPKPSKLPQLTLKPCLYKKR